MSRAMETVGVRQLKARASEIVRRVRDRGETVGVTVRGRIVARIVPAEQRPEDTDEFPALWREMDELAAEIGARWPAGVPALEAVQEGRREL